MSRQGANCATLRNITIQLVFGGSNAISDKTTFFYGVRRKNAANRWFYVTTVFFLLYSIFSTITLGNCCMNETQ